MCQRMWCTCEVAVVLLVAAATLNRKDSVDMVDINCQNWPITGCSRSWYTGMMYWKQFLQAPITHLSKVIPPHPAVFVQLLSMRFLPTILEPGTGYVDSRFQVLHFGSLVSRIGMRIPIVDGIPYKVFSHDVTTAILVFQNNKSAAMLVSQTNPVGVELFSYAHAFFCFNKLA